MFKLKTMDKICERVNNAYDACRKPEIKYDKKEHATVKHGRHTL